MKKETKILIYSMINNFIIAIIKFVGGITYGLSSLIADGLHTFSDFITDVVSLIGAKISNKRPTKYHPFGFGKVEYLTNLFVGMLLFILGIYIIVSSFFEKTVIPPLSVLILLFIVFILKLIAIIILHRVGSKVKSGVLITSALESKADLYSTIGVIIITLLLQCSSKIPLLKYSDLVGSILIGLIVLKTAYKIIADNSLCLIGEVEEDEEQIKSIKDFLDSHNKIKEYELELVKYGPYYRMQLDLVLDPKLSLKQATNFIYKLKKEFRYHHKFKIRYITIYVTDKLDKKMV